jgi:hypothetical protein
MKQYGALPLLAFIFGIYKVLKVLLPQRFIIELLASKSIE